MGTYPAFILDKNDRVTKAHVLGAENDEAALIEARQYLCARDVDHMVGKLTAKPKS